MYVFHEPQENSFEKVGVKGKLFITNHLTTKVQYFLIETDTGHETEIIEHVSDFIYYVLQGSGYFQIDGSREDCHSGDLVVVPAGKRFIYKGTLRMIATSTPPWTEDQEETVG